MGRQIKTGLDYFPLDVDILNDDAIYILEAKHGNKGFAILIKLWIRIYGNSYFCRWGEREALIFSRKNNVDINDVNDIIQTCLCEHLFNKSLHEKYGILTSESIQTRYLNAANRRKQVEIIREYALVNINEYENAVYVDINTIEENNGTQSKGSKVKDSSSSSDGFDLEQTMEQGFTDLLENQGRMSYINDLAHRKKVDLDDLIAEAKSKIASNPDKYTSLFRSKKPIDAASKILNAFLSRTESQATERINIEI